MDTLTLIDILGVSSWSMFLVVVYIIATLCDALRDGLYGKTNYIKNKWLLKLLSYIPFDLWTPEEKLWHVIKWIGFYGYGIFVVIYFGWISIVLIPIGYFVWRFGIYLTGQKWDSFWLAMGKKLYKWIKSLVYKK